MQQQAQIRAVEANPTVNPVDLEAIVGGVHGDPFSVLGPHPVTLPKVGEAVAVRVFVPGTVDAWIVLPDGTALGPALGTALPMRRLHEEGFFEIVLTAPFPLGPYRLRLRSVDDQVFEAEDPYRFHSILSEYDLYLLGEGTHYRSYDRLGAHVREIDQMRGVGFAVWAPNAKRVSVVGDFNHWDGRRNPMRFHPSVGIWDIFLPGLTIGAKYKFELIGANGALLPLKSDPVGFATEVRPNTASIVFDNTSYSWGDQQWLQRRAEHNALSAPVSVYEVHLGSWIRDPDHPDAMPNYRELAHKLVDYVKKLGFTHIQLLPVSEHPFDGSWGYQTLGYFAPTSRYGSPNDFKYFVDYFHQHDIGVLVDWVPAHFPRDDHGLRFFDGTALYEHADPRQGEHPDWGTLVFNYGRNEVANFLISNALFWFDKYHIDGIRVDAVASMLYLDYGRNHGEWVPNRYGGNENLEAVEFIKRLNELIHHHFPGVLTVAEESTAWSGVSKPTYLGGLGFSLKWNMGWMNDTLRYMHREPVHRKFHHNDLTFSLIYAFSENFMLPLSHDEVVHGKGALLDKMPGDTWQRFANLRLLFGYMFTHPGKKLLFMGGEFGQWQEWRCQHSLDWHLLEHDSHKGVQKLVADLNHLIGNEPALHEIDFEYTGFEWIDCHDGENSTLSYLRKGRGDGELLVIACNFTPVVREKYRIGVPRGGYYREVLNTDAALYGGSNVGNSGGVNAEPSVAHDRPFSLTITLPPLAAVVFKPT